MPQAPPRFAGLDGLRAIAVIAVIAYHLFPGSLVGGYLGVDVFFVISGFLITALLLREHEATGRIALRAFWARRARRLLPAIALLVLVTASAAALVGGDVLVGLPRQVLGAATFSSNWLAIAGSGSYFDATSPELLKNLWSLAVEEQFYLLWPLALPALLVIPRRGIRVAVVGVLALASAIAMAVIYTPADDATRVYYGTDTHAFGLGIGALVALATSGWASATWRRRTRFTLPLVAVPSLALVIVAICVLPDDSPLAYRGGIALVAIATAGAIVGGTVPGSLIGRLLDVRPMRWIGERSYGLYLWHWPLWVLAVAALPDTMPALQGLVALVLTVAAAVVSYRVVEMPIRRDGARATIGRWAGGWRGSARTVATTAAASVGVLALIGGTVTALALSPRESVAQTSIEAGIDAVERPAPSPSAPVALPGGDQITAIGDSVMLASAPELQRAFPGIAIDAVVSRQMREAPALVAGLRDAGALRPTVLIGLGTNGPIDDEALAALHEAAGRDHHIVVVNVQAPRGWTDGVNAELAGFAQRYRDVELANWQGAIADKLSLLAGDQIHPGDAGGAVYASTVAAALQRLAELPPLLRDGDYGLAPRPE